MKQLAKNYGISLLWVFGSFILLILFFTLLYYLNWISTSVMHYFKLIIPLLALFMGGLVIGRRSKKKGWLEGLKIGLMVIVIFFLLAYLGFDSSFSWKMLFYDSLLVLCSMLGSMLGINKPLSKLT